MNRRMEALLYTLGGVLLVVGLAGVVLPAVPGSLLLGLGAVLIGWADGFQRVGWGAVITAVVLAVIIWAVDLLAGILGARAFGASKWAVIGAGLGLLAGLFFGLPGLVLGPAVGAIALEYLRNPDFERALKAGAGAFLGFVLGSAVKVALAFVLIGVLVLALVI
ncbi:MAG: DUF456 domain-containing protein [Anaeromyxobacter sp.]